MWIALTKQPIAERSVATISDQREYLSLVLILLVQNGPELKL